MENLTLPEGWQIDVGHGFVDASVPGCWEQLIPSKRFAGPVTYRLSFPTPPVTPARRLLLLFDAVSYYCEASLNGRFVGSHEGMWDRFFFDVTDSLLPAGGNELRLTVWKPGYEATDRFPLREVLSGFIPDVLCTFGGIWGEVALMQTGGLMPESVRVRTELSRGRAEIGIHIANHGGRSTEGELDLRVTRGGREIHAVRRSFSVPGDSIEITESLALEGLALWSLDEPSLYDVRATVRTDTGDATLSRRIGLHEFRAEGERLLLNGRPVYLRGALHWGYYPEKIIPRPTRDEIRHELSTLRDLGFNAVKHCLWVPRAEYLDLCDEMGFLAWLELPLWLPRATPLLEPRMRREYPRIMADVAHHPSLVIYSLGCELGRDVGSGVLESLARMARERSGGALVRDNSGSGECYGGLAVDYSDFYDYHFYADVQNLEPLMETFTPQWRARRPWLFGEYADADTWRVIPSGAEAPWWSLKDDDLNPLSSLKPDFRAHLQPSHAPLRKSGATTSPRSATCLLQRRACSMTQ